jgi:hypothetical protein
VAVLLEYECDKLNGQRIYYYDDQEYVSEIFGVYTYVGPLRCFRGKTLSAVSYFSPSQTDFAFLTLPLLVHIRSKYHPLIPGSTPDCRDKLTNLVVIEFKNWAFFLVEFSPTIGVY